MKKRARVCQGTIYKCRGVCVMCAPRLEVMDTHLLHVLHGLLERVGNALDHHLGPGRLLGSLFTPHLLVAALHIRHEGSHGARTLVGEYGALVEKFDSGEPLDVETRAQSAIFGDVHLANLCDTIQLDGELVPDGLELLAVAAPRGVELHQPITSISSERFGLQGNECKQGITFRPFNTHARSIIKLQFSIE